METLDDIVAPNMRLLSIGLNPSLPSVDAGFYFANPRNRFWKALNASSLLSRPVSADKSAMRMLLQREGIGFTDLVKRPTRGAGDLRAADYREGAPRLLDLLNELQPDIAWFHGKLAFKHFLRHTGIENGKQDCWGRQACVIGASAVFVTPNPSPANAVFSLQDLVDWYNRLSEALSVYDDFQSGR